MPRCTVVAVVFVALSVGCSQPISPTSPTSALSGGPSITSSGGNATSAGIPGEVAAAASAARRFRSKAAWKGLLPAARRLPPRSCPCLQRGRVTPPTWVGSR